MGLGLGLALGMGALDMVTGMQQERTQNKAWNKNAPIRKELRSIFNEQTAELKGLPGILRRAREGRISTAQGERRQRLSRALAASGATPASDIGMIEDRRLMRDTERMISEGELADKQAIMNARQGVASTGMSLMNALSGKPTAYNPLSAVKAGIGGYALGSALGRPMNPVGASVPQQSGIYGDLGGQSGYTYVNPKYAGFDGQLVL